MGPELFVFAFAVVFAILFGAARLLYRLVGRGAGHALTSLDRGARSLFGPNGPPEELCRRLVQKHPELRTEPHGGLSFTGSGCKGRLDFISDRTEIRFELDPPLRATLGVSAATIITRLAEDDPDAFQVRGSDAFYQQIFSDPELARMLREWRVGFEWTLGASGFCLQIRALPHEEEELWRWLKGAFRLLQAVPGFESEPSVRITSTERRPSAESVCQVCGASLAQGPVVFCRRCATPHHEECWTYARECSTFACKERRFER
jgi:hypothetical protein